MPDLPYNDKPMYVFTHEPMTTDRSDVIFVSSIDEYLQLVGQDKTIKRVWLLGGAELVASFAACGLIDECIITVIPTSLGGGIALPKSAFNGMHEVATKHFSQGIVEKKYVRK